MTQAGITDFSNTDDTPPKPTIKNDTEFEVIVLVQEWAEQTFRGNARQILECIHPIDEERHGKIIDDLVESHDPIEPRVTTENTRVKLYGHQASAGEEKEAIDAAIKSDADHTFIAIHDIETIGRDIEEIREHAVKLLDAGVTITLTTTGNIEPDAAEAVDVLLTGIEATGDRLITEIEAIDLVKDEREGGRPPIGFESVDGKLRKSDNYTDVRAALKAVITEECSKAAAAREIGCASKTITRAITEHPDRYQL